jgi:hypothetical protein
VEQHSWRHGHGHGCACSHSPACKSALASSMNST